MSKQWNEYRLGEITASLDSKRRPVRSVDRVAGPYPYWGASGVVDYVHDFLFEGPSILVSEDGENLRTRKTPIVFLVSGKYWVNNHAHVLRAREGFDLTYLAYHLETVDVSGFLTGSTQPKLTGAALARLPVRAPALDEQRRIAGVLGALDDLIDTNEQLMSHFDALGMAVFLRDWDQATWAAVSELGEVTMGQSPPSSSYNEEGEGLPFFQGVRDFGKRFPSERVFCTEPTRCAEAGDILIAVRAPVGDTNVATVETAIGRGLAALHAKRPAIALRALRASVQTWAAHQGTGTVFSSINGKDLRAAKVPHVDSDAVETTLQTLDAQYSACSEEVETLRRTRDELLPLLMSGKIRVLPDEGEVQADQRGAA